MKGHHNLPSLLPLAHRAIEQGFLESKPTIDNPTKLLATFDYLRLSVSEIWLYDLTTGEVLKRLKASSAEAEPNLLRKSCTMTLSYRKQFLSQKASHSWSQPVLR